MLLGSYQRHHAGYKLTLGALWDLRISLLEDAMEMVNETIAEPDGAVADAHPEGISSLLDTDLYKLTMQCAVLKYFSDVGALGAEQLLSHVLDSIFPNTLGSLEVTYTFTNRTSHMKLTRGAFHWLEIQVASMFRTNGLGRASANSRWQNWQMSR